MIWLLRPDQPKPTEFALAMGEDTGILPGLPAVAGKPVHVAFDGGRLTSDAGILLLSAVEQRLRIAERLAACLEDPRDPDRVRHELAEMIRYRALLIAAGYPDGNDCDALRCDPAFKMAVGRMPECRAAFCSTSTTPRTGFTAASNCHYGTRITTAAAFCRSIFTKRPPASRLPSFCAPARRRTEPRWRWCCAMSSAISAPAGRRSISWCAATAITLVPRRWRGASVSVSATSSAWPATR